MRHWTPNQKLTKEQIATIKHLRSSGVRLSLIANTLESRYGVSKCVAYYHASDNREAYDNQARKQRELERQRAKQKIYGMIQEGLTTAQIANYWNMPLKMVNDIYAK
jgi:hypothetical protein